MQGELDGGGTPRRLLSVIVRLFNSIFARVFAGNYGNDTVDSREWCGPCQCACESIFSTQKKKEKMPNYVMKLLVSPCGLSICIWLGEQANDTCTIIMKLKSLFINLVRLNLLHQKKVKLKLITFLVQNVNLSILIYIKKIIYFLLIKIYSF